jgi:hypothetical protein
MGKITSHSASVLPNTRRKSHAVFTVIPTEPVPADF